jgi:hypothetical protein
MTRERIVVIEGPDEVEHVTRERVPANDVGQLLLGPMEPDFAGTGPARGAWEAAQAVVYIPPVRRAA